MKIYADGSRGVGLVYKQMLAKAYSDRQMKDRVEQDAATILNVSVSRLFFDIGLGSGSCGGSLRKPGLGP
jgi:hypothetical protein